MIWLIIILIVIILIAIKTKKLKVPNVYLVTGGVKTGKSALSVCLALKTFKKNLFKYYIYNYFLRFILRKPPKERPGLYSNIKLRYWAFSPLTMDVIERNVRIPYGSVVLIDEASLLADSMSYKNEDLNEKVMLFVKLFGHATRGGTCIINTQSLKDMHMGFKRCISTYLWIHSRTKFPIFTRFKVREMLYSEDTEVSNTIQTDVEDDTKTLWMYNSRYKYYDCFCYSVFTDDKPVYEDKRTYGKKDSLKTNYVLSFRKWKSIPNNEEDKK